jgi:hypothetical protein
MELEKYKTNTIGSHIESDWESGVVVHTCNLTYSGGRGRRIMNAKASLKKGNETLLHKQNTKQKDWRHG